MKQKPAKTLNEQFTDFADVISEGMGRWWITALSIILILIWLASGPYFHYSDSWQLIVNTPTTIVELWIGFLLAAAANRVEKRNREMQEQQAKIIQHIDSVAVQEELEVADAEKRLLDQDVRILTIAQHLDQQDKELLRQTHLLQQIMEAHAKE